MIAVLIYGLIFGIPAIAVLVFLVCLFQCFRWKKRDPDGMKYRNFRRAAILTGILALILLLTLAALITVFMIAIAHM